MNDYKMLCVVFVGIICIFLVGGCLMIRRWRKAIEEIAQKDFQIKELFGQIERKDIAIENSIVEKKRFWQNRSNEKDAAVVELQKWFNDSVNRNDELERLKTEQDKKLDDFAGEIIRMHKKNKELRNILEKTQCENSNKKISKHHKNKK